MNEKLRRALEALASACEKRDGTYKEIEETDDDTPEEEVVALNARFDTEQADVERCKTEKERLERIIEARDNSPLPELEVRSAQPNGTTKEEPTYRPDKRESFFNDILASRNGSTEARDRLDRNRQEAVAYYRELSVKTGINHLQGEAYRDMANASTTGGDFVPTIYLNSLWVHPSIAGRPFADALPKYPLPDTGTTLSLPSLSSGVTMAGRADAGTVSETDGVTAGITHDVNEIAGQVDIGRIVAYRSDPGLDMVIGQTLVRRYNGALDTYCLSGTGTAPQHFGIRAVVGANATAYTDGSPTVAEFYPKLFSAASDIATNRKSEVKADAIVLHPRRAAWLASGLSSTFPLFQQGNLMQAAGTQDNGFVNSFAGLRVIEDANVGVTYGVATNEDEVYLVALEDFYLAEGPLLSRVFEDVGSGTGVVRFQMWSYSSFLSKRYPKSISIISGTGLTAPTFS